MPTQATLGNTLLVLKKGDITEEEVDVIVNAANSSLMGGGGVDGAIHRKGGPEILAECQKIRKIKGSCPTGDAVITSAGALNAKYVVHAVGPIWHGGDKREPELLKKAYLNSLILATEKEAKTIAFPSISTGIYGYPVEKAAAIALETVSGFVRSHPQFEEIRFILFSDKDFQIYKTALKSLNLAS